MKRRILLEHRFQKTYKGSSMESKVPQKNEWVHDSIKSGKKFLKTKLSAGKTMRGILTDKTINQLTEY
ncbi:hypothetical protein PR048_002484 [Dryococelus australis]|uniref:Uncharacterized protein n=1 Tax=Dryococelus australis TaxID=614101 RepID=A0ABQ9IKA9_9NEOP|nr:hypothetical protein PR048_002484 [Dryococelus australis]